MPPLTISLCSTELNEASAKAVWFFKMLYNWSGIQDRVNPGRWHLWDPRHQFWEFLLPDVRVVCQSRAPWQKGISCLCLLLHREGVMWRVWPLINLPFQCYHPVIALFSFHAQHAQGGMPDDCFSQCCRNADRSVWQFQLKSDLLILTSLR